MATILDKILQEKKKEVAGLQEKQGKMPCYAFKRRSFIKKLETAAEVAVIAEYKRKSPSKGLINAAVGPVEQAKQYEDSGASAISVLTDHAFFQGTYEDLTAIKEAVQIPVLCKDFIIDPVQIDFAAASGADLILLIAAAMDEQKLAALYRYACLLGLEVLLEVHNREELEIALRTGAKLIGVNNRDLNTFNVTLDVVGQLGPIVKKAGAYLVSESGIHRKEDVDRVRKAGANAVLVGESLMKSSDIKQQIHSFILPLSREVIG